MKKEVFFLVFSVLFAFILYAGTKAYAETITFETDTNQIIQDSGIKSFENAVIVAGDSTANDDGNKLGAINYYTANTYDPIYIEFDAALESFSFKKWEPISGGYGTVYWQFFSNNTGWLPQNDDSEQGTWVTIPSVTFAEVQNIIKIKIWGDNAPYYLDNLTFELYDTQNTAVPEPASMLLLGVGLMGLAGIRKVKK